MLLVTVVKKEPVLAWSQFTLPALRTISAKIMVEGGTKAICFLFIFNTFRTVSGRTLSDVSFVVKGKPCQMVGIGGVSFLERGGEFDVISLDSLVISVAAI